MQIDSQGQDGYNGGYIVPNFGIIRVAKDAEANLSAEEDPQEARARLSCPDEHSRWSRRLEPETA